MPRYIKLLFCLWIAIIAFAGYKVYAQYGFTNFGLIHSTTNPSPTSGPQYIFDGQQDIQWGSINQSTHTFSLTINGPFTSTASGGGPSAGFVVSASTNAAFAMQQTSFGADQKWWDIIAGAGPSLYFRAVNDANTTANTWLQVNRGTGTAITSIVFPLSVTFSSGAIFNGITTFNTHIAMGAAVGTVSACGTGPLFRGTDNAFQITVGTVASTTCTYTFGSTYTANPFCAFTSNDPAVPIGIQTLSTTAITIFSTANMTSKAIFGICLGS